MKALLIAESRQGELLASSYEPLAFAQKLGAETAMFLVGSPRTPARLTMAPSTLPTSPRPANISPEFTSNCCCR